MTNQLEVELVELFKHLHRNPELSHAEYKTTALIKQWLKNNNIPILDLPLKTGVVAEIIGDLDGPTIALRTDIDALPINEETTLSYRSEIAGVMHACGHDFHTASILGAAILLNNQKHKLRGTVRIIFQPAEENGGGASHIVKAGGIQDVEAIFGMHNKPDLPVGTIGIKSGGLMAAVDHFIIKIKGVGGHAGMPESTIDPIVIAAQFVSAIQSVVSRNISPFNNTVISVTRIDGGNTWNVIPNEVTIEGTVRTFQEEDRAFVKKRMSDLLKGYEVAYSVSTNLDYRHYLHVLSNDGQFTELFEKVGHKQNLSVIEAEAVPAGEDFSYYLQCIPGYFIWFGSEGEQGWHHPSFTVNPSGIILAANYFSEIATQYLEDKISKNNFVVAVN